VNLKWAALAAAVCVALGLDPILFLGLKPYSMAPWAHVDSLRQAVGIWVLAPRLALVAFLVILFLEQSGRVTARPRRTVAGVGAVLMGVEAALALALVVAPTSIASYDLWSRVWRTVFGVFASALWAALLSRFAAEDNPFQGAATRLLALILAAETAFRGLWWTYDFVRWAPWNPPWRVLGHNVALELAWISVLVFLLSVRAYGAAGRESRAANASPH
jgi:hypothetical protein